MTTTAEACVERFLAEQRAAEAADGGADAPPVRILRRPRADDPAEADGEDLSDADPEAKAAQKAAKQKEKRSASIRKAVGYYLSDENLSKCPRAKLKQWVGDDDVVTMRAAAFHFLGAWR